MKRFEGALSTALLVCFPRAFIKAHRKCAKSASKSAFENAGKSGDLQSGQRFERALLQDANAFVSLPLCCLQSTQS
eukprot:457798-Pelagomonas_calceolata.AAC.1